VPRQAALDSLLADEQQAPQPCIAVEIRPWLLNKTSSSIVEFDISPRFEGVGMDSTLRRSARPAKPSSKALELDSLPGALSFSTS
jgi:hypothetical protein